MDGTSSNMYWIVSVVVVITLLFVLFRIAFPSMGEKIMGIMTHQVDSAAKFSDDHNKWGTEGGTN